MICYNPLKNIILHIVKHFRSTLCNSFHIIVKISGSNSFTYFSMILQKMRITRSNQDTTCEAIAIQENSKPLANIKTWNLKPYPRLCREYHKAIVNWKLVHSHTNIINFWMRVAVIIWLFSKNFTLTKIVQTTNLLFLPSRHMTSLQRL